MNNKLQIVAVAATKLATKGLVAIATPPMIIAERRYEAKKSKKADLEFKEAVFDLEASERARKRIEKKMDSGEYAGDLNGPADDYYRELSFEKIAVRFNK